MIISNETTIQDFALFEGDTGALKPLQFTRDVGGEWVSWSAFKTGDNVHSIILDDGVTLWEEGNGFTVFGPAINVFLGLAVEEVIEEVAEEPVIEEPVTELPAIEPEQVPAVVEPETAPVVEVVEKPKAKRPAARKKKTA